MTPGLAGLTPLFVGPTAFAVGTLLVIVLVLVIARIVIGLAWKLVILGALALGLLWLIGALGPAGPPLG